MNWIEKRPVFRLIFSVVYLMLAVLFIYNNFTWVNSILSLIMIFGCYISLVKAKIIKDPNARNINNYNFDFISIIFTVYLFIRLIKSFLN